MAKVFRTNAEGFKNVNLSVKHHRDRIGCDICKKDYPTECFIGWCGNVLWICHDCFKKLTEKKSLKYTQRLNTPSEGSQ